MALLLRTTSIRLAAVSISMAASLRELGAAKTLFGSLVPSTLLVAVLCIHAVGNVLIRSYCARNAAREDQEDSSKFGPRNAKKKHTSTDELARDMGFRAYRNQALCAGVFAVMACLKLVSWTVKFDFGNIAGSIVDRVFAIPELTTPFVIAGLLFALNTKFLPAVITVTRSLDGADASVPD
jgi:hypothetical protein